MNTKKAVVSLVTAILLLGAAILVAKAGTGVAMPAPLVTSATAAVSFGGGNTVGAAGYPVRALASGDLDNDGDPDVVSAVYAADNIAVWENDGSPFSGVWISGTVGNRDAPTYALPIGDLDNDGNLDIASGSGGDALLEIVVWQNDGTPFVGTWTSNGVVVMGFDHSVYALAMADLDNNGDLDLVSGDSAARVIAWPNDGTPFIGPWPSNDVGATGGGQVRALAVGDLDNDGDLDVVSGDIAHQVVAWQNDGTPFTGVWISQTVFTAGDGVSSMQLIDLDGDGDLDVAAGCGPSEDHEITTWENDGTPFTGTWVQHDVGAPEVGIYAIAAADLDVDGDFDLASGSQEHAAYAEVRAWENSGSPFSGLWSGIDVGGNDVDVAALTVADLDRDGDPDVVAATSVITAWPNTRTPETLGNWTEVGRPALAEDTLSVALTDFDYDGKLDVASGTAGHGMQIWRGNGGYAWTYVTADSLPSTGYWTDLAWGQIDNSEYPDLAAASDGDGLRAWLVMQVSPDWANLDVITQGLPSTGGYKALDLDDVDHDGLLDLVACGKSLGVRSWQGTGGSGSPHWNARTMLSGTLDFCDVALGHVNQDGNLDVVAAGCGSSGVGIPVWRGYGDFSFTPAPPVTAMGFYEAVALGDVDNDGDTDVVAAPRGVSGVRVWLGDGGTTWTDTGAISPSLAVLSLDLSDFDNDGYLDILAGLSNYSGVRVWKGDGGASWTDASTNLPTTRNYPGVAFGRVDGDANLDVVAAESGGSGVRVWTAVEPPPGGWRDFQPYTSPPYVWERSRRVTCTVQVGDVGSGLDVSTAEYCFARDGGATCVGGWLSATVSGSDGATAPQVMTATNVPFDQDSETQNTIQFHIRDMAGFTGTSPLYRVAIDSTPPTNPGVVNSTSHVPGVWNSAATVVATWTDGVDATSGVRGYSYELTDSSSTLPTETIETTGNTGSDVAYADGTNWWFHLRTVDRAGNWATSAVHVGPFWIDRTAPGNPATLQSSSHTLSMWSNDPTVDVSWTAASDGSGSGIAGYWYSWREFQQNDPLDDNTTGLSLSSGTLSTGDSWYFNLRTRDNMGRKATEALNLGPFYIDTDRPESSAVAPGSTHATSVSVLCSATDFPSPQSGAATCDLQYKDTADGIWRSWLSGHPANTSATFTGEAGHTYCFRSRAYDNAGNVENWPADADGDCCTELRTDLSITDLEVTQVIQNLANEVPLVEDKDTWVRVYVTSSHLNAAGVTGRLHGRRGGAALPDSPLSPRFSITARTDGGDRGNLHDALLFHLPTTWRSGTVEFTAEVDPDDTIAEDDEANNAYLETVTFQNTGAFCIVMVPVHLHPDTYYTGDAGFWDIYHLLERLYPVGRGEIDLYTVGTMYPRFHWAGWEYGLPQDFNNVLFDLACVDFSTSDPCDDTHYWGMVHPSHLSGRWGMANCPGDEGAGVMDSSTSFSAGYPQWSYPMGGIVIAHELGHNFGRVHVLCTGDEDEGGDVDPDYPYDPCQIGPDDPTAYYGFVDSILGPEPEIITPTEATPLMSYGSPQWISEYTYRALFGSVGTSMWSQNEPPALTPDWAQAEEYLFAAGTISPTAQTADLRAFYRTSEPDPDFVVQSFQQDGKYSLVLEDAGGVPIYTHTFTATVFTAYGTAPSDEAFIEVFPYDDRTARIVLKQGETELASRWVSANAPTVTVLSPNGGESFAETMSISWTVSDEDGDDLHYTVQYSPDDGGRWLAVAVDWTTSTLELDAENVSTLPGGDQARIRVIATDGVNTGEDQSDAVFILARKSPQAYIAEPKSGSEFEWGSTVVLGGAGLDAEDGSLGDEALAWTSNLSGTLGTGGELWVSDLITGSHRITLTATDSDGDTGTDAITIFVGVSLNKIYLPIVLRDYGP